MEKCICNGVSKYYKKDVLNTKLYRLYRLIECSVLERGINLWPNYAAKQFKIFAINISQ